MLSEFRPRTGYGPETGFLGLERKKIRCHNQVANKVGVLVGKKGATRVHINKGQPQRQGCL